MFARRLGVRALASQEARRPALLLGQPAMEHDVAAGLLTVSEGFIAAVCRVRDRAQVRVSLAHVST